MMKNAEEEDRENRRKQIDAVAMAIGWKDRRTHTHTQPGTQLEEKILSLVSLSSFYHLSFILELVCACLHMKANDNLRMVSSLLPLPLSLRDDDEKARTTMSKNYNNFL